MELVGFLSCNLLISAEEIKTSPSESPLMRKKNNLKEQDEIKTTENSIADEEERSNVVDTVPHKAALEERAVSFNLGDLEEIPEREKMKETVIDSGE